LVNGKERSLKNPPQCSPASLVAMRIIPAAARLGQNRNEMREPIMQDKNITYPDKIKHETGDIHYR